MKEEWRKREKEKNEWRRVINTGRKGMREEKGRNYEKEIEKTFGVHKGRVGVMRWRERKKRRIGVQQKRDMR